MHRAWQCGRKRQADFYRTPLNLLNRCSFCGRRLAGDAVSQAACQRLTGRHRRQAASYQTTCKPLKKLDFVGADLSANAVIQPMNIRRMYRPFRGQVRSHLVCRATALRRRRGGASHSPVFAKQQRYAEYVWAVHRQR
ncbi:hypothetical protein EZZ81_09530 [Pseudomonas viridiflava]|uniref:Uncharacterized protein n=1 Tax=Pseudomonas viridiflava TaxID=33069 RepID=A0AA46VVE0_PSEVI|nr:hypothetical protein EZZ81_09530 [Pseudomonas viridiflava]